MQTSVDISIRSAQSGDIPFIYSTMLKSLQTDSIMGKLTTASIFYKEYRHVIDDILFDSTTLVACDPANPEVVYGYLIYQRPNIIHYAFTKQAFRRLHVQTRLLNVASLSNPVTITHKTKSINFAQLRYNPFLLYRRSQWNEE